MGKTLKATLRPGPGGCSFLDSSVVRILQNPATLQISENWRWAQEVQELWEQANPGVNSYLFCAS